LNTTGVLYHCCTTVIKTLIVKMRFIISTLATLALIALASADVPSTIADSDPASNSIEFRNIDSKSRTIYFTAQVGFPEIDPLHLSGLGAIAVAKPPHGWIGNCYAVTDGAPNVPGALGEFAFNGYENDAFYDVSLIVTQNDPDGIKQIWPKGQTSDSGSGCTSYETQCGKAYYLPDDVQTRSSNVGQFICTVGNESGKRRRHVRDLAVAKKPVTEERDLHPRDFVLGANKSAAADSP
jgi:hypothetical protein